MDHHTGMEVNTSWIYSTTWKKISQTMCKERSQTPKNSKWYAFVYIKFKNKQKEITLFRDAPWDGNIVRKAWK